MQLSLSIMWRLIIRKFDLRLELLAGFMQGCCIGMNFFCPQLGIQALGNKVSVKTESLIYLSLL